MTTSPEPDSTEPEPDHVTVPRGLTVQVYTDADGEHRWRALAANNKIVATSGEGYHNLRDCEATAALIFSPNTPVHMYTTDDDAAELKARIR